MRCEVRDGSESVLLDPETLEDDVRYGRVTLDQQVRVVAGGRAVADTSQWPPPGEWVSARAIPALADAARAPAAVLGDRFRHPPRAWMYGAFVCLLLGVYVAQLAVGSPDTFDRLALGFVPSLVDAGWWTPWTAALLHVNFVHLFLNLPILLYCGWRVERVMGAAGVLLVAAASVLGATPLVAWFSAFPVVGASVVAYGLWGAQIALGLRLGDQIPAGWRSRYGWGNLVLFLPLFLGSLGEPGVSDLGHVGGLLGGVLAAFVAPLEGAAAAPGAVRRRVLAITGVLAVAPCLAVFVAARSPTLLGFPSKDVAMPEQGYTIVLPERLAAHEFRIGGMPAWSLAPQLELPFYAALLKVARDAEVDAATVGAFWARRLGAEVTPLPDAGPPVGEGWVVYRYTVGPFSGFPAGATLTQHTRVSGRYAWGVGWFVPTDRVISPGLEEWYTAIGATLVPGDPPDLVEAKVAFEHDQRSFRRRYNYALELSWAGRYADMAAVLAPFAEETDGSEWDAMRITLDAWESEHGVRVDEPVLRRMVEETPATDLALLRPALDWFVARGDCAAAGAILAKTSGHAIPEDWRDSDRERMTEEIEREKAAVAGCGAK